MIKDLIVVTGGAGFIGSNLVEQLGERGRLAVVIDDFATPDKWANVRHPNIHDLVNWTEAFDWLDRNADRVAEVFHLGAISSTTASDLKALLAQNVHFSNAVWDWCAARGKPLVYASSAATYGDGSRGFSDAMAFGELEKLAPLNPYGWSKHLVDLHVLRSAAAGARQPPAWYGVKFFNVYGPREHHKGDMRSVALKLYEKVKAGGQVELFRSYRPDVADGMQSRDFIHVGDSVGRPVVADGAASAERDLQHRDRTRRSIPRDRESGHRRDPHQRRRALHRHAGGDPRALPVFHAGRHEQIAERRLQCAVPRGRRGRRRLCPRTVSIGALNDLVGFVPPTSFYYFLFFIHHRLIVSQPECQARSPVDLGL